MEGKNLDKSNSKRKLEEVTPGKSQNDKGKNKLKKVTDGKSKNEKVEQKMEVETEAESQNSKSFQCDFCEKFSSKQSYTLHGYVPVSGHFPCYYTMEKLSSSEWFLKHLNVESRIESLKRIFHVESAAESVDMRFNNEDWESYINDLPSSEDQEKNDAK